MSPQSHVLHCRVLPLSEFTVMIPEPHATLQGAVTWRNQCHDHATLQGVIISSAIIENCFSPYFILFWFLMQFGLWRSAAFVLSPIHLFGQYCFQNKTRSSAIAETARVTIRSVIALDWLKQASHWHEFCSRNGPQYGVPRRAILVARSLSKQQSDA